ncbi:hypothetical protein BOTBODRAFT_36266 [Botryobasidium botryosum FD-172 SS1]|uniref:Uncharacterized protein n=1 Tax=Botryobasidium botryosum (strain FD-172 SS1) TaxID=930990 RepID=A0A067M6R6_BOTB1|nr:hypothetical protein BOTBODRAFT_36266 [Botryobasidium botryosum FD-172 SS1]
MVSVLSLLALLAPIVATSVHAMSCAAFDSNWNLYAFGVGTHDVNLGQQNTWTQNGEPRVLNNRGRPPFNGKNTQCFLAQYFNAIYVMDGDASKPDVIHIFDASTGTWSTQKTQLVPGLNLTSTTAILDHDTNVFYGMHKDKMYSLNMTELTKAQASPVVWKTTHNPFWLSGDKPYEPVMAIAQNHIHFIGAPNLKAGEADIFVIHYAYFQPEKQYYQPVKGSSVFPSVHGQTASFANAQNLVQEQFAFIPDNNENTYVIDVQKNTTTAHPAPPVRYSGSGSTSYAASPYALVQLSSSGQLAFMEKNGSGWVKFKKQIK